jgi:hypothetical protein
MTAMLATAPKVRTRSRRCIPHRRRMKDRSGWAVGNDGRGRTSYRCGMPLLITAVPAFSSGRTSGERRQMTNSHCCSNGNRHQGANGRHGVRPPGLNLGTLHRGSTRAGRYPAHLMPLYSAGSEPVLNEPYSWRSCSPSHMRHRVTKVRLKPVPTHARARADWASDMRRGSLVRRCAVGSKTIRITGAVDPWCAM